MISDCVLSISGKRTVWPSTRPMAVPKIHANRLSKSEVGKGDLTLNIISDEDCDPAVAGLEVVQQAHRHPHRRPHLHSTVPQQNMMATDIIR